MYFKVPKYKIDSTVEFIADNEFVIKGKVEMITLALKKESTNVYYSIVSDNKTYTVEESEVFDIDKTSVTPKYKVGEAVTYRSYDTKGNELLITDIISSIDVHYYDEDKYEIYYSLESDESGYIIDDDILERYEEQKVSN